jgi:hypothetical protein
MLFLLNLKKFAREEANNESLHCQLNIYIYARLCHEIEFKNYYLQTDSSRSKQDSYSF